MKLQTAFLDVSRVFLDTAPVIYYVENNPAYTDVTKIIFDGIDSGRWQAITSAITLAEALVVPYRLELDQLQHDFAELIVSGANTTCVPIDSDTGREAARLRAVYNLTLIDAIQVAAAIQANCDVFLTNDVGLKRVTEIEVLLIRELEA